jgi:hypothetical protein
MYFVAIGHSELRHYADVAFRTQAVDIRRRSRNQANGPLRMDGMALDTRDGILHVAALKASGVRRLIEMARKADFVCLPRRKLQRIPDVIRRGSLRVLTAGSVAGLTGMALPLACIIGLNKLMRTLDNTVVDVFMTGLTSLRPGVLVAKFRWRFSGGR